ncbi:unnamed protein product [Symbiodinium sp. KB8]|nr:unnamed protein product [Symbiodinium sp. KB8]
MRANRAGNLERGQVRFGLAVAREATPSGGQLPDSAQQARCLPFYPSPVHILSILGLLSVLCLLFATGGDNKVSALPKVVEKMFKTSPGDLIYMLPFTLPVHDGLSARYEEAVKLAHERMRNETNSVKAARRKRLAREAQLAQEKQAAEKAAREKKLAEEKLEAEEAAREEKRKRKRAEEKLEAEKAAREKKLAEEKLEAKEAAREEKRKRKRAEEKLEAEKVALEKKLAEEKVAGEAADDQISIFCFSLVVPWTGEPQLIAEQLDLHAGIAACDNFAAYSSQVMELGKTRFRTRLLPNTDLHAAFGGQFWTVLNTRIFKALWRQVLDDQDWVHYDWTIKLDPDTVFFPGKFKLLIAHRTSLQHDPDDDKGVVLVNCRFGLHGPLEALSKQAMSVYNYGWRYCPEYPPQEDVYLQHCTKQLGIRQMQAYDVLAEKACHTPNYQECTGNFVSFHPFKSPEDWERCMRLGSQMPFRANGA